MRKFAFLNKLKGLKKWEGFLPLFFIGYLLFTLAWQYDNLSKHTDWIDKTDKILVDLKETDNHIQEMHGALQGFQPTARRVHIDEYRSSLQAFLRHYSELIEVVQEP